jgi:hypothetical protein
MLTRGAQLLGSTLLEYLLLVTHAIVHATHDYSKQSKQTLIPQFNFVRLRGRYFRQC